MMNLPPDIHATRRRAALRQCRPGRAMQSDYQREKDADTGRIFPAVCWLAGVIIVTSVVVAVVRQVAQ